MSEINWSDLAYKAFWTGLSAVLGFVGTALLDVETWWAVPATMAINAALAWVRQRVGTTPPTAPTRETVGFPITEDEP